MIRKTDLPYKLQEGYIRMLDSLAVAALTRGSGQLVVLSLKEQLFLPAFVLGFFSCVVKLGYVRPTTRMSVTTCRAAPVEKQIRYSVIKEARQGVYLVLLHFARILFLSCCSAHAL